MDGETEEQVKQQGFFSGEIAALVKAVHDAKAAEDAAKAAGYKALADLWIAGKPIEAAQAYIAFKFETGYVDDCPVEFHMAAYEESIDGCQVVKVPFRHKFKRYDEATDAYVENADWANHIADVWLETFDQGRGRLYGEW